MIRYALVVSALSIHSALGFASAQQAPQPVESRQAKPQESQQREQFVQRVNALDELKPSTQEERARSRRFDGLGAKPLVAGSRVLRVVDSVRYRMPFDETPTRGEVINKLACSAPVVVVGKPTPRRVRMNEAGTFLFTEYSVSVSRWIVQNAPVPRSGIEFLVEGGEVAVGGDRIVADSGQSLLRDMEYLLFLKPIPDSRAFVPAQPPIPVHRGWSAELPFAKLPQEIKAEHVTFDTFVADLVAATSACSEAK
jgi:hypothetical protein